MKYLELKVQAKEQEVINSNYNRKTQTERVEIVCMSTLPASIKRIGPKTTEKKWRHHYRSDSLTNHNVRKFIARHSFVFVSIQTVQEVLRILETYS